MNKELKKEIFEHIDAYVKYGFYDVEDICFDLEFILMEEIDEEKFTEVWLQKEVEKRYNKQLQKEKSWSGVVSFDRLATAFDVLSTHRIITLHKAGYTTQEGEEIACNVYDELKAKGIKANGYCYYHTQDVERAMGDIQNLYIRYGDFQGDDDKCQQVGKLIVTELKKQNLEVHWSESINDTIEIKPFLWQKRHDGIDYSSKRTTAHILATQTKSS
ncbi:hypothetical protein QNI16_24195 [Cytophagaceae bacterium YF14B1]|uniref:DUF6891 domain-containing protein n=1 Tax=Xanthocytophaga flava TaxID=3048013 RepID=A0AAE3QQH7_9BACT|nr:hypothetical protein [Xanthocytophaga flavus]MDJ1483622.1 hypothetical protein [Xanthocytophaga flavus]